MHLEILVEGQADRTALEPLLRKIIGPYTQPHTWRIHKHQGKGKLPADLRKRPDPLDRTLLHQLPAKLRAYGKSLGSNEAVVVLVDADDDDCRKLKRLMIKALGRSRRRHATLLRIAIEELEAWYLGDRVALLTAFPHIKQRILRRYRQDKILGTWELLADALYPGGAEALLAKGRTFHLEEKRLWAKLIAPGMDPDRNRSPSFRAFRDGVRRIVSKEANPPRSSP